MKKATGFRFLLLALCAFAGLGIEALYAFLIEPVIYNASMREWTTTQNIAHWIITCVTWGVIAAILVRVSKKWCQFDLFAGKNKMKVWQWISVIVCVAFSFIVSYISWDGFKVIKEFQYNGWLKFIFQYIYYGFETALFLLIIIFVQKACEQWFKRENIPYGGIAVALTWGLGHILSKSSVETGLLSALGGFMFGIVYLLVNRDIKKTFPILFLMFVL